VERSLRNLPVNSQVVIVISLVTAYLVWLIVFILVIERWLRQLTGRLLGVTIARELQTFSGPSGNINFLDILDAYRWKVNESASLTIRFVIGLLRITFWGLAVCVPLLIGLVVLLGRRH
jgi:hypothetical protein